MGEVVVLGGWCADPALNRSRHTLTRESRVRHNAVDFEGASRAREAIMRQRDGNRRLGHDGRPADEDLKEREAEVEEVSSRG